MLIRVDDSNEFSAYWIEYNSPRLRPVGYSRSHGITLIPPTSALFYAKLISYFFVINHLKQRDRSFLIIRMTF